MHNTRSLDRVGHALVDLMSFFASPQRDQTLLRTAGVELDRALFPLLVRLADGAPKGVAELAEEVGRDHTTVSRQLAKLESLGLVERPQAAGDRRVRAAQIAPAGETVVVAIADARRRLLSRVLASWSEDDLARLGELNERLAMDLKRAASAGPAS